MNELLSKVLTYNRELKDCLQAIFDELNQGQTKKVMKNEMISKLVEKYKITHK